jgi:hypothetical protein
LVSVSKKLKILAGVYPKEHYNYMMTVAEKMLICALGSMALIVTSSAVTPDAPGAGNPYQGIVDRNVFGLKPPPPPPDPELNKPPPPKVTLAGIMGGFGTKRAIMKVPPQAKPGDPGKEMSYILSVGEREGDLEVVDIDEKSRTVRIKYAGVELPLNFESNGVKLAASAPMPAAVPGGNPGGIPSPMGTQTPGANPFSQPGGGFNKSIPTRTLRLPTPNNTPGAVPMGGSTMNGSPMSTGNPSVPLMSYGNAATPPAAQGLVAPESHMTPEQQVIMMELERERNRNNPNAPPIPPTELTTPQDAAAVMAPGSVLPGTRSGGRSPYAPQ